MAAMEDVRSVRKMLYTKSGMSQSHCKGVDDVGVLMVIRLLSASLSDMI